MTRAKMSKDGSVVIPKSVRDAHGLTVGAEFEIIEGGKQIVLELVDDALPAETSEKLTLGRRRAVADCKTGICYLPDRADQHSHSRNRVGA